MAEETKMQNIDINEFDNVQTLKDSDYFVLSLFEGTPARVSVGLFKSVLEALFAPRIKDGVWYINNKSLNIKAEGKTPEFREGAFDIEYRYMGDDDSAWKPLVSYSDIKLQFDKLSKAQKEEIGGIIWEQVEPIIAVPVSEAIDATNAAAADATNAANTANEATERAVSAAQAAEQYANRVKDIFQEQWEDMLENGTWEEGIEYNVYED